MLPQPAIEAAAAALEAAEQQCRQIDPLSIAYPEARIDDAYAIQRAGILRKLARGRRIVGYKIGLTSRAMQQQMRIDEPDYGVLLDSMQFANGASIDAARFSDPRVEVELAFVLKHPLRGEQLGIEQVLDATEHVIPALEIIAARSYRVHPHSGYARTIVDTIADNAAGAGFVLGGRAVQPRELDLRWVGALCHVNEVLEETGLAAGVLDHPANGICWVARRFARHGIGLEPGQIILSGSFTRAVKVQAGDAVRVDYGALGSIRCEFR